MRNRKLLLIACLVTAEAAGASETISYSYDARGRLVQLARTGTVNNGVTTTYGFDKADNRLSKSTGTGSPPAAPPAFAVGDASVAEGGTLVFTVSKSGATSSSFSVAYATAGGTATSGTDFTAASGTLTFAASETGKTVNVATIQDTQYEANETLVLNLSAASGGATIADSQGTGTIQNDDSQNLPPTTVSDTMSVARCGSGTKNVVANDSDPEGNLPLELVAASGGELGNAYVASSTSVGYYAYDQGGTDVLTYTVKDSLGATSNGTLTVAVSSSGTCL